LDRLNAFSDYWEQTRDYYRPFDTAPRTGSAEVYLHEMPGGQYTNLKEQAASMGMSHRWPEIARTYAEVNALFGDIVKVTPSSKVVGDLALFLFSRGIKPADLLNLEPGSMPFPESVIDMLMGGLGWPEGGWPEGVWKSILGGARYTEAKAKYTAAVAAASKPAVPADPQKDAAEMARIAKEAGEKYKRELSKDDLYSHLMYPQVFAEFQKHQREYSDVSVLPTPAFFYGLKPGEEITVEIEEGKVLIIRLVNIGEPDKDGRRTLNFDLNGMAREVTISDKTIAVKTKARPKADLADPLQLAAPIPGLIAALSTSLGAKVAKGDKLLMMEAMKMQTTVYAPASGVVAELNVAVGDTVEAKDLLLRIRS
ncbi:MAG TPA: pyruvate carboxylase, partial [Opitutaceae bacterium]|nr:pyruvate carboxylase [Opitutaceae bacterium]